MLRTTEIGQIQIQDDEVGAASPESAQRLFSARRLPNLRCRLGGEQSSQSGADYRVIIDDQNLHGSADCTKEDTGSNACG
jgi:hypothetical protein